MRSRDIGSMTHLMRDIGDITHMVRDMMRDIGDMTHHYSHTFLPVVSPASTPSVRPCLRVKLARAANTPLQVSFHMHGALLT